MRFRAADGSHLHVQLRGPEGAPAVVLVHGFPLTGAMWSAQVAALEDAWRLVVPDLRGFGASEVGDGQYAIDFFVDDLFETLDAVAPGRPVVGCGLSMGGYVLLRAVEREPDRFRALVLADTKAAADADAARLKRLDAVRTLRKEGVAAYAAAFVPGVLSPRTLAERPEVAAALAAMIRGNPAAGLIGAQLAMAGRTDTTAGLAGIRMPTLVVVGEDDAVTPPDVAREMAGRIPGARLVVIPGAGHMTPLEAPGEFTRALRGFLEGL